MTDSNYKNINISKIVFYFVFLSTVMLIAFGYGLYSGTNENAVFKFILDVKKKVNLVLSESPNAFKPIHFIQPSRYAGSGVTINKKTNSKNDLIFLTGFFDGNNELRLINRDGKIISRWPVKFSEIFPNPVHIPKPPTTDWNVDLHGAVALQDGSIVFNFEYGGIVKLDHCGKVIWTIPTLSHHSVEKAEAGGFWVPGRTLRSKTDTTIQYSPFSLPYKEDVIMKISANGTIESKISIANLLYVNGYESFLTSTGEIIKTGREWDHELVHLNKITELKADIADDFPLFKTGDLLLSLRSYNTLLVIDPKTQKIKWLKTGPWIRQHDPEFKAGGTITVFNNNTYLTSYINDKVNLKIPQASNIIEIDPLTNEHKILYGKNGKQKLLSVIRGKHELTPSGGILMTELETGRAFEVDSTGTVIWQYINRYDEDSVLELTEARAYPKNYFNITDWSCQISNK